MIKFLNHASFIVDNILVDPWFEGSVFLNGWNLLKKIKYNINKLKYDYIFISHEHPDHFDIKTLKSISNPEEKTIIFHKTEDRKIIEFVENLGFKVLECENYIEYNLTYGSIKVVSDGFDSFFVYINKNNETLVNLNDFQVTDEDVLKKLKLEKIDYLLSQFCYANWAGNVDDKEMPLKAREIVYSRLKTQFKILKPKAWVPFASFIYFSHSENFYMNKYLPTLNDIYTFVSKYSIELIIPVPGFYLKEKSNEYALQYWNSSPPSHINRANYVSFQEVKTTFIKMINQIYEKNKMELFDEIIPTIIYVIDWNCYVSYDIKTKKFIKVNLSKYDVKMSSECLNYLMKYKWGRGTLLISARIQINYSRYKYFFNQTNLYYYNNIGKYLGKNLTMKQIYNQGNFYESIIQNAE